MIWRYWPENIEWSFQVWRAIGVSQFSGSNVSEIMQTVQKIKVGDVESWHKEWKATGDRVFALAENALAKNHSVSARNAYLRAVTYYRTAEFMLRYDDERKIPTYLDSLTAFKKASELMENPPEFVKIPYENNFMPAHFYSLPGGKKGPTVVVFNGADSTKEEMYFSAVQGLLDRGFHVLMVDGAGQGEALRLNRLPFRPDYEVVGTAALEWALARPEVDPERVGLLAWSFGGYLGARMVAFENRYKCCALWGGLHKLAAQLEGKSDDHPLATFLQWILGCEDVASTRKKTEEYDLDGVAELIKCPTYVLHNADDELVPVWQAEMTYEQLRCQKWWKLLTEEDTGSTHCSVDNLLMAHYYLFDWLEEQLK